MIILSVVVIVFALLNALLCVLVEKSWLGALGWFTAALLNISNLVQTP